MLVFFQKELKNTLKIMTEWLPGSVFKDVKYKRRYKKILHILLHTIEKVQVMGPWQPQKITECEYEK